MSMVVVAVVIAVLAILCLFLGLYFCDLCDTSSQGNGRDIKGDGGWSQVFKGTLPDGEVVAIKKLAHESEQRERDQFNAEVATINRTRHKNVVKLIGYCDDKANRLIIYEYVPNNSLRDNLHGKNKKIIDLSTRFKIALASAEGLAYLHECNPRVIHRDIKTANILLDDNFEPKIADFGLAKDFSNSVTHISTDPKGTKGYVAPENLKGKKLTDKSDVFSFGVVLLELVTGKQAVEGKNAVELAVWIAPQLKKVFYSGSYDTLVDDKLREEYNKNEAAKNEAARMLHCAAACVYKPAAGRPKMSEIVEVLKGNMALECVWQSRDSKFLHDGAPYYSIV
ncbi:hypothetical protein MANES_11G043100v8 [Manihot esculenta]|uniref:Uncharacterized protein n=1 Tax=Manihot esculenta TaxID=3983 RepID=A0ACB7GUC6_MANES|nr:hypothetical protein MANES_11G043100v8 [Manihot esculenta]